MTGSILNRVRTAASKRLLFPAHAIQQMSRPDRMITTVEVETVATEGELIEDYPEDTRGHSCLLLGFGEGGRPIHAVCSPKDDYLAIITAYLRTPRNGHVISRGDSIQIPFRPGRLTDTRAMVT